MAEIPRSANRRWVFWGTLIFFVLLYVGWIFFSPNEEDKIFADLMSLVAGTPAKYINQFDLVCFSYSATAFRLQTGEAIAPYRKSLESCGLNGSCCNLNSDTGVVGLGRNGKMQCVEIRGFDYWTSNDEPLCAPSDKLEVATQTADQATATPGHARFSTTRTSFRISTP